LESLARINFLVMDANRGKPLPKSLEPLTRFNTYAHLIDMGHPLSKSLDCNASPTPFVLLWKSVDVASIRIEFIRWSWTKFLLKSWPTTKLFLATWCQSKSRSLFPWS